MKGVYCFEVPKGREVKMKKWVELLSKSKLKFEKSIMIMELDVEMTKLPNA